VPTRPRIHLKAPPVLYPGQSFELSVELEVPSELHVDRVTARLTGTESAKVGSGKQQRTQHVNLVAVEAVLSGEATFAPGKKELRARFELPPGLPPTYSSTRTQVQYEVRVHVDIPWWPDARKRFALYVGALPMGQAPGAPAIFAHPPGGPRATEAAFEGSLGATVLTPGGGLRGAIALLNVGARTYRGFTISLLGQEQRTVTNWTGTKVETSIVESYTLHFPTPTPVEGEPMQFSFEVPPNANPTTVSRLWRLDWFVEVELNVAWASDPKLRTLVVMLPRTGGDAPLVPAPPSVGSPRLARLWRLAAEELGMTYETGALRSRSGDVDLEIVREHRGRDGLYLVARVHHPSLHLGLHLRKGEIKGRDAAQVRSFLTLLGPRAATPIAALSDELTRVEVKDGGQNRQKLILFARDALRLADGLAGVYADLPIPTHEAARLHEWQELARRLDGPLERGRLGVQGMFRGTPAEIEMRWTSDGAPLGARLTLRPPYKLGEAPRSPIDGGELSMTEDALTLDVPPPGAPLELLDRLDKLHELAQRMAPPTPYR
jgi:hypothetical protein